MTFRDLLAERQQALMAGMLPQQALSVACTQLLAERPDDADEIEAAFQAMVAETEAWLRARREASEREVALRERM